MRPRTEKEETMRPTVWIAVALLLLGAIMLLTGVGAAGLWIAVITVGIALVVIYALRGRHSPNS
jgi:uncharacterized membrane-anchored protein